MNLDAKMTVPWMLLLAMVLSKPLGGSEQETKTPEERGPTLVRVDGKNLATSLRVLASAPSSDQGPALGPGTNPNAVVDGWSSRLGEGNLLTERYSFVTGDSIVLNLLVKAGSNGFAGMCADFFLIPCGIEQLPPRPSPIVFFDDVHFGPSANPDSILVASVTVTELENRFPAGSCVDWFVVLDFDETDNPDSDGDLLPDCGVETGPRRLEDFGSADLDELGVEILGFFNPGPGSIEVAHGHPPSPASKAPGAKDGEDGVSRPWCFRID